MRACPFLCLCSTCLFRSESHEACLRLCSVQYPPTVDAHGTWVIGDGVNLSNNVWGTISRKFFSTGLQICVSCWGGRDPSNGQLQKPVPGFPVQNALLLKTKGKSSKQANKQALTQAVVSSHFNSSTSCVSAAWDFKSQGARQFCPKAPKQWLLRAYCRLLYICDLKLDVISLFWRWVNWASERWGNLPRSHGDMDWMFVSLQNSYCAALIHSVMVFGGLAFGR